MSKTFNTNTTNNDEWLTPPSIIRALGEFDLDPCSPINRPWDTANKHYTKEADGLYQQWVGRVWCNPPYGRDTWKWLAKLSEHGAGTALVFARTETKGFHSEVWDKAHSVFFFKGRIAFHYVTGEVKNTANAPSCLVSYSKYDTECIVKAVVDKLINGKLVTLIED
jgi:hypothetical protein